MTRTVENAAWVGVSRDLIVRRKGFFSRCWIIEQWESVLCWSASAYSTSPPAQWVLISLFMTPDDSDIIAANWPTIHEAEGVPKIAPDEHLAKAVPPLFVQYDLQM